MSSITYKEIMDQYKRLAKTDEYLQGEIENLQALYNKHSSIVYLGCGSSFSLAKSMALATTLIAGRRAIALPAGDTMLRIGEYRTLFDHALVVVISRSGSTSEIIGTCRGMKDSGVEFELVSFSATVDNEISNISDYAFEMPWIFDQSVCQTSCVTNFYYISLVIVGHLAGNDVLLKSLETVLEHGDVFLHNQESIMRSLAELDWNNAITLGDSIVSGICEEGALAFKEICQKHSNFYHLLDSRHGPMVLVNNGSLVLIAVDDTTSGLELDLVKDYVRQGASVITVSDLPMEVDGTTNVSFGKRLHYAALGIPFINMAQLLSYYKAVATGVDPDSPTGLSPWIKLSVL